MSLRACFLLTSIISLSGINSVLFAQSKADTSLNLHEVVIQASPYKLYFPGQRIVHIDSIDREEFSNRYLRDLLQEKTDLYVKTYGSSGISTISSRGLSSSHINVMWNGFPLGPNNLGSFDFSTVPAGLFDDYLYIPGGSSSLFGSSAIGGSLMMSRKSGFNQGIRTSLQADAGSFGAYSCSAGLEYGNKNFSSYTSMGIIDEMNAFSYINETLPDAKEQTQKHARRRHQNFYQQFDYLIDETDFFSVALWYSDQFREIPASKTMQKSFAEQDDEALRMTASWKHYGALLSSGLQLAYFGDDQYYNDSLSDIYSAFFNRSMLANAHLHYHNHEMLFLTLGGNASYLSSKTDYFPTTPSENRFALYLNSRFSTKNKKFATLLNIRQEYTPTTDIPLLYLLGIEYRRNSCYGGLSFSKNFRMPSFNDLYWYPGGNPSLKPETSYSTEANFNYKRSFINKKLVFSADVSAFANTVENWIQWVPLSSTIWSPLNYKTVISRGFDVGMQAGFKAKLHWTMYCNYQYVQTFDSDDRSVFAKRPQQLIYVPEHKLHAGVRLLWSGYLFSISDTYNSSVYTSSGTELKLEHWNILNIRLSKTFLLSKHKLNISGSMRNILDANYEVVQYYPMPGRSYHISLRYDFQSK